MVRADETLNGGVTWVIVADASVAEIFSRRKRFGSLETVHRLEEPDARAREQAFGTDAPGRSFDRSGQGRHAMEPDHTVKEHLREVFASRIADDVEAARVEGRFQRLVLVAAPKLLGELRERLSRPALKCISAEFAKDMTGRSPEEIAALIDGER